MSGTLTVGIEDLARLVGVDRSLAHAVLAAMPSVPLNYRMLSADEHEALERRIAQDIETRDMRVSGDNDPTVWQRGWDEVASRLTSCPITYESLRPQYFHEGAPPCRLRQTFIQPDSREFEYWAGVQLRALVLGRFMAGMERIVEFGCGTGINLYIAAQLFPNATLIGTDWAAASAKILSAMAQQTGRDICGHQFNMLTAEGWSGQDIDGTTGILTVHAMEQLHTHWGAFLAYVRARKPALCVHIEPILELYDPSDRLDDLAARYHRKRRYLEGYLPALDRLAAAGEIKMIERSRVHFGGQYHEAYSLLVWRPE